MKPAVQKASCCGAAADNPDAAPSGAPASAPIAQGTIYTCPMHPQIRRSAPGSCPICGMALEPARAFLRPKARVLSSRI
jgi:rubrerythrin